ncbi:hypothetical protein Rhe02_33410 [Rhizocola hellebori]|uniref:DUF2157 domain-containing protein n=1 Tax=Rhizocola hellebori TaxID=1392758 RepID=A0A8J3VFE2_9ACTN|nr:hypothetical protein Rhe02_33410 [Rhizocola hellebori]
MGRLVASGELTQAQAEAVRREFSAAAGGPRVGWLIEVAGYLGGGLILGGAALLVGSTWDRLGRGWQTAILAGVAALFVAAALLVAEGPGRIRALEGARRRVVGVLLALTSIPAAFAAAVAASDYDAVWGFWAGLAVSLVCLWVLATGLGVAVAAAMSVGAVVSLVEEVWHARPLGVGVALLGLGAAWAAVTVAGWARPKWLGLLIGFGLAIVGAQLPLAEGGTEAWAYALTLAVAAGCLVLYRWERSLMTLAGGVIGVTLAVPEMISDLTDGAVGGAAILLIAGVVLVTASAAGMRWHRRRAGVPD